MPFRHSDVTHVEELLAKHRGSHPHALIATDGVFSMDGDLSPLPELAELGRRFDAWLMADDAHGLGVIGNGRGSTFAHGEKTKVALQMGTLSKAVGGYGGFGGYLATGSMLLAGLGGAIAGAVTALAAYFLAFRPVIRRSVSGSMLCAAA